MQIKMHVVWEYFSTSLVGVVGVCEKLHDFFVQYLKPIGIYGTIITTNFKGV